jgi:nitric oxide reductase NorQ protein
MNTDTQDNKTWGLIATALRHCSRVLVWGLPGTGKSYLAQREALAGREVYNLTLTEDTSSVELRGHYVPKGSELVWQDGPAILAWRAGGRLIVNEADKAAPEVQSFLLALMDDRDSAAITLPTGETVRPAEGFQLIATSNTPPEDMPEALRSRLPVAIEVTEPNPEALLALPEAWREAAKRTATCSDSERRISLRAWYEYHRLTRAGVPSDDAGAMVFGPAAPDLMAAIALAQEVKS